MSYAIPPMDDPEGPDAIAARLVAECSEFAHLKEGEVRLRFLFGLVEQVRNGRQVLGEVHLPAVQGKLKGVFDWMLLRLLEGEWPDFLVILDNEYWSASDALAREILVFHELCHCIQKSDKEGDPRFDEEGRPVWGLLGHDVEEFTATVARYGAYSNEIREFIEKAASHDGRSGSGKQP